MNIDELLNTHAARIKERNAIKELIRTLSVEDRLSVLVECMLELGEAVPVPAQPPARPPAPAALKPAPPPPPPNASPAPTIAETVLCVLETEDLTYREIQDEIQIHLPRVKKISVSPAIAGLLKSKKLDWYVGEDGRRVYKLSK